MTMEYMFNELNVHVIYIYTELRTLLPPKSMPHKQCSSLPVLFICYVFTNTSLILKKKHHLPTRLHSQSILFFCLNVYSAIKSLEGKFVHVSFLYFD